MCEQQLVLFGGFFLTVLFGSCVSEQQLGFIIFLTVLFAPCASSSLVFFF